MTWDSWNNPWKKCGYVWKIVLGTYYRKHKIHTWVKEVLRMVTFHVGDLDLSERDVRGIIVAEVLRIMREDFLVMINTIKNTLILLLGKHLRIIRAELEAGVPWACGVTFKEFGACGALQFVGSRVLIISMRWIIDIESDFLPKFYTT